jgi:hypothetical protein
VSLQTDAANCGTCGHACASDHVCTSGACACTGGAECPGGACPIAHPNGLGGTFFSCNPLDTLSASDAVAAANAFSAAGTTIDMTVFGCASCVARQTASQCAVWCEAGSFFPGKVALDAASLVCQCPTAATATSWR